MSKSNYYYELYNISAVCLLHISQHVANLITLYLQVDNYSVCAYTRYTAPSSLITVYFRSIKETYKFHSVSAIKTIRNMCKLRALMDVQ